MIVVQRQASETLEPTMVIIIFHSLVITIDIAIAVIIIIFFFFVTIIVEFVLYYSSMYQFLMIVRCKSIPDVLSKEMNGRCVSAHQISIRRANQRQP